MSCFSPELHEEREERERRKRRITERCVLIFGCGCKDFGWGVQLMQRAIEQKEREKQLENAGERERERKKEKCERGKGGV